jgi:hypothetical protein
MDNPGAVPAKLVPADLKQGAGNQYIIYWIPQSSWGMTSGVVGE